MVGSRRLHRLSDLSLFLVDEQQVGVRSSDWTKDYHLFQMKWEPGRLTYYIDNVQSGTWTANVPARQMYLMLNFDVGDGASPLGRLSQ